MAQIVAQKALLLGGLRLSDPADCKVLLAMPKATAAETFDRIDRLQEMILNGEPNTVCLVYARQTWRVSRAQGYNLVKRAWAQIKDDSIRAASTGRSC